MNPFQYFFLPFKKYAEFRGRSRRKEFWYFNLISLLIVIAAGTIDFFIGQLIFYPLYMLISFIPSLAVFVRRLHDTNKTGWWFLIGLIPLLGAIIIIFFLCQNSDVEKNNYGYNPKFPVALDDEIIDHVGE